MATSGALTWPPAGTTSWPTPGTFSWPWTVSTPVADTGLLRGRMFYLNGAFPLPATATPSEGAVVTPHVIIGIP